MAIGQLKRRRAANAPEQYAITSIYQKFLEVGSVGHRAHTGRPSTSKSWGNIFVEDETVNRKTYL